MDSHKPEIEVDPDYESNNSAIKRAIETRESQDNKKTAEQITQIIEEEFDKEITARQNQIELIEEQLFKAQKLLHVVRYVLITSYYENKALEFREDEASSSSSTIFDQQNRLHPAIKKLLGSNESAALNILHLGSKRKVHNRNDSTDEIVCKKIKKEEEIFDINDNNDTNKSKNVIIKKEKLLTSSNNMKSKNRKRTKCRIIIGNISKWMSSLEDENLTHKWMVYVRGSKEAPSVAHIVDKVVFYLHPSYKPFDVVEINQEPFHLARRGWGEFPIRVQIFFKNPLNKPVDIVHNLKLDKTYTGRQTLGNETIVDVFLHEDCPAPEDTVKEEVPNTTDKIKQELDIDIEDDEIEPQPENRTIEHDYCYDNIMDTLLNSDPEVISHEHSYSITSNTPPKTSHDQSVQQDQNNSLIYGLGESYTSDQLKKRQNNNSNKKLNDDRVKTLTTTTGQPICFLPQSFSKILLTNGSVMSVKVKSGQNMLKQSTVPELETAVTNNVEQYKIVLPKNRFKNMGEVLPYLFRKLPLFSSLCDDVGYKRLYPFTAQTMKEYCSWCLPKRLSSEWSRAKTIKKILYSEQFFESNKWNTKALIMYGRSHFYTPLVSYEIFNKPSPEKALLCTLFENSNPNFRTSVTDESLDSEHDVIDIENDDTNVTQIDKSIFVDISDPNLREQCTFIRQTALECGIILKSETIADNCLWNGAERMIYEAVKCFADSLIRRASNYMVCKGNFNIGSNEITTDLIETALCERKEVTSLHKFKKRKRVKDYFT